MFLALFFLNVTVIAEIYTLSLHDALPILPPLPAAPLPGRHGRPRARGDRPPGARHPARSEEHTSELQSHHDLVCRLLLEKKKQLTLNPHGNRRSHKKQPEPSVEKQNRQRD